MSKQSSPRGFMLPLSMGIAVIGVILLAIDFTIGEMLIGLTLIFGGILLLMGDFPSDLHGVSDEQGMEKAPSPFQGSQGGSLEKPHPGFETLHEGKGEQAVYHPLLVDADLLAVLLVGVDLVEITR